MNELTTAQINVILQRPFAFWRSYQIPQPTPIETDLLNAITDYDLKYLNGIPDYNAAAHNLLINTYCFYHEKAGERNAI